ncbi:MAG TPA: hypothetical protein VGU23_01770 [Acidobacteriaceae bacterium]|nr:hypothetical protein [Acidobacteriaceae bacterium]
MKRTDFAVLVMTAFLTTSMFAQRHERDAERVAESEQIPSVNGGTTVELAGSYDSVFDVLVTYLKRSALTIDSASRDAGQIASSMMITGGWHQTGKRTVLSLIKDSADKTSVRVTVTLQKRYKAFQVEPWSDPKVDTKESAAFAEKLTTDLTATLAQKN